MKRDSYINMILSIVVAMGIGAIVVAAMGFNPVETYVELFKGAFVGSFNFGGTLERFVPLMLTALAFAVAQKVNMANVGVEGDLYLGAIGAAWVGYSFTNLPSIIHIPFALTVAMIIGALWAAIPGILKAYYQVNDVCSTILLNYVAMYITSYLVNNPMSAGKGVAMTPQIAESASLMKIMAPSRANIGLFIALAVLILTYLFFTRTKKGYEFTSVGLNDDYSEFVGIQSKKTKVLGMMFSGAIGGLAGGIEVLGIYGYFLDGFSTGIGFDGMLAALIAKSNIVLVPVLAFFIAALKQGALAMERFTGVPKSLIDAMIAMFILFATMEGLFILHKKRKAKLEKKEEAK
ncbi:MAG: ABC transporter permease [Tissierellia bacterium]|nr:ABC transporter permease [Tissierellia bacterium]